MQFFAPKIEIRLRALVIPALAAVYAAVSMACTNPFPETHKTELKLTRAWSGFEAGKQAILVTVHPVEGPSQTGGSFFDPIVTTPVELKIARPDGSTLAFFSSSEVTHTHQDVQIENMGRGNTRQVDTFDGHNADGVRVRGTVVSQYAMRWSPETSSSSNAWAIQAQLTLSDSSGDLGEITGLEYIGW